VISASYFLVVNGGSSSLKSALFTDAALPARILAGAIERIGQPGATLRCRLAGDPAASPQPLEAADQTQAVARLIEELRRRIELSALIAIGHRIVHGGDRYFATTRIDDTVLAEMRRLSPLDPAHLPGEIAIIEGLEQHCPGIPQIACFDTAFHRELPRAAQLLPIPRRYAERGVRKYGFHGLSYAYLLNELERVAGSQAARGRVILAHLGAGCSLAATSERRCVETTMGFTPTGGLMMGTRSGDLDPGILLHLLREDGATADQLDDLVNRQSGLLGLSETSPDIRDLLECEPQDVRAAEAIAVFCQRAKQGIGACAAALGGLDTLIFAAGIGENSPTIRSRICAGMEFLGVHLDSGLNEASAPEISGPGARVSVRVIKTDEESMIAIEVRRLLGAVRA